MWAKIRYYKDRPNDEISKECSVYLGIYVSEKVLSDVFQDAQRMPNGTRGYDLICRNGYKIDVKSSCVHYADNGARRAWLFSIKRNKIADYFMCLGFDNRESLNPMHIWLIPGYEIRHLKSLGIIDNKRGLAKWMHYEQPIDAIIDACNRLREKSILPIENHSLS